jgi:hypothetical protein
MKVFEKNKYAVIKKVLNTETCDVLRNYFFLKKQVLQTYIEKKYISPFTLDFGSFGDAQSTKDCYCIYGDALSDSLLPLLKSKVEKETGIKLFENYTYMRIYSKGSILERHKDRLSCEISTTLNIDNNDWPIFVMDTKNKEVKVSLKKGDMLIYKGCDLEHWRNENPFDTHAQIFIHYNNIKTKNNIFDSRPHLGLPLSFKERGK